MPNVTDSEQGWIALSPAHLLLWGLLALSLLRDGAYLVLPMGTRLWIPVGWGFTGLQWLLGAAAFAAALKAREGQSQRRIAAMGLAVGLLVLHMGQRFLILARVFTSLYAYEIWMVLLLLLALGGLAALVLLLGGRDETAGGEFDAAVVALVAAGALVWPALLVLAIAAMAGHPLLAAQWEALREPQGALAGKWHDGLDEGLRLRNLGAAALVFLLFFLVLACSLVLGRSMHGYGWSLGWTLVDPAAVLVASPLLGIHVLRAGRKSGLREGRGMALAALLVAGLLLLLALAGLVILVVLLFGFRGSW